MQDMRDETYTLSATDAVMLSGASVDKIRNYVSAGLLDCLLSRRPGGTEWFAPADVEEFAKSLRGLAKASMDARRVSEIGDALRAYLTARPPLADYDDALAANAPVLAKTRSGVLHAHVQPDVLAAWADTHCPDQPSAWIVGPVRAGLKLLGAVQVRGISGLGGGGQRWHVWWRLPLTIWAASPELSALPHSVGGARETGEKLRRIGEETMVVADAGECL